MGSGGYQGPAIRSSPPKGVGHASVPSMPSRAPLCLVSCTPAADVAAGVAGHLGTKVIPSRDVWFACGEGKHIVDANVRGGDVYVFQQAIHPGERSVYDRFVMLLHAVDAIRLADADRITVVLPYFPCGRQDKRKGRTREGVSTGLFARLLESAGVDMVITVEPHNEAMGGCFDPRRCVLEVVHVTSSLCSFLQSEGLTPDIVSPTDAGGMAMARRFAQNLGTGLVAVSKERDYARPNTVVRTSVIGDVTGKDILVVDDMVDTGGSLASAVRALWHAGARDMVVLAPHMLLSGPAWSRMHDLHSEAVARGTRFELVGSTSILQKDPPPWYRAFDLNPLLARVVRSVNTRGSVRAAVEHG